MCWGDNGYGQIGESGGYGSTTPIEVPGLGPGALALSAGAYHTCALTQGGGALCWGRNARGQLGDGTVADSRRPVAPQGLERGVAAVAAGHEHTCALVAAGAVKCWGNNALGQLADGTVVDRATPTRAAAVIGELTEITAGGFHTCARTRDGAVACWGQNVAGQLGDGVDTDEPRPVRIAGLAGSRALAAGGFHTCVLNAGGKLLCWGRNDTGQLGDGEIGSYTGLNGIGVGFSRSVPAPVLDLPEGTADVFAGGFHTCARSGGGALRCWGGNDSGQLGDGARTPRAKPAVIMTHGVAAAALGGQHSCAMTFGGAVKCWGKNLFGQLGIGNTDDQATPQAVRKLPSATAIVTGGGHACALDAKRKLRCWGLNDCGRLGDGTEENQSLPVPVKLDQPVKAATGGSAHTCAVTPQGALACWGKNEFGQLGDGTRKDRTKPTAVPGLGRGVAAVSAGFRHTCALMAGGSVKCWGLNDAGQLGTGTKQDSPLPADVVGLPARVRALSAGWKHTCVLADDEALYCWGDNEFGQIGNGRAAFQTQPVYVAGLGPNDRIIAK